jgi:hypothetical protein
MWGQGLNDEFKFYNLIKNWLERPEVLNRPVNVTLEAHSGANIFPDKDVIRPLAQKRHGEINVSNPPILFQVESALDSLLKRYPTEAGGIATVGKKVDLILMDGGANDFGMRQILLEKTLEDAKIKKYAQDYCLLGMTTLLRVACATFPRARIVVTGYYPLVSPKTNARILSRTLLGALGIKGDVNWPFHKDGDRRDEWARRSAAWVKYTDEYLRTAVKTANDAFPSADANPRVAFAPINFAPEDSYATFDKNPSDNKSRLWYTGEHLVTEDDKYNERRTKICVSNETSEFSKTEKKICMRAGTFHPNHRGAELYRAEIQKALTPYIDELKKT